MRVVGTIGGALLGIWLAGDYASTPAIHLFVFFLVLTFSGYKFGQLGARQVPYAYFLLGLTMTAVVTYGVTDPAHVWQIGLNHTLAILLVVISLKTIRRLVLMHTEAYVRRTDTPAEVEQIHQAFGERLSVLKNLLQAGTRESTVFSARLSNYNAFLVSLTRLFHVALDLSRRQVEPSILGNIQHELELVADAIAEEFDILTGPHRLNKKLRSSRLNEAFAAFEEKVSEIQDQGILMTPLWGAFAFYGGFVALRALRDGLNNIRSLVEGLPRFGRPLYPRPSHTGIFCLRLTGFG